MESKKLAISNKTEMNDIFSLYLRIIDSVAFVTIKPARCHLISIESLKIVLADHLYVEQHLAGAPKNLRFID